MKKMDLVENENIGISSSTLAKMSRGETVSMSILEKICMELDCDFGDIISIDKNNKIGKWSSVSCFRDSKYISILF